eukprot:TRINITY_DN6910_c0_g3_i1.p1 TRINITY_DN6910_c0_g3~~TRINITY_DN6910_c0_g3_i1.p1  ORF type:complete len:156 (-),score=29.40 TRINITY_DN6910_c0_g3_i1:320-787(-)
MAMRAMISKFSRLIRGRRGVQTARKSSKRVEPATESEFIEVLHAQPQTRERGGQLQSFQEAEEAECATRARVARDLIVPRAQTLTFLPDPEEYLDPEEGDAIAGGLIVPRQETMIYIPDAEEYLDREEIDALRGRVEFDDDATGTHDMSGDEVDD